MVKIGDNLKRLRTQNHMTQKELAEQLNVSAQAVSRWENDEVEPSLETLGQLAAIFSISVDELFGKETPQAPQPEPEIRYVETQSKPVLAVCEKCNKPLYDSTDICRDRTADGHSTVKCRECDAKDKRMAAYCRIDELRSERRRAWIWGGIAACVVLIGFIIAMTQVGFKAGLLVGGIVGSVLTLAFIACCFFDNTFVGEMWQDVCEWGAVKMPGVIFSLDFDGIVFLIAAKILFFILGVLAAIAAFVLATALGLICGIFALPFAIGINQREMQQEQRNVQQCNAILKS